MDIFGGFPQRGGLFTSPLGGFGGFGGMGGGFGNTLTDLVDWNLFGSPFSSVGVSTLPLPTTTGTSPQTPADITRWRDIGDVGTRRTPLTLWTDVWEFPDRFDIRADIPGIKKEDVHISMAGDGDILRIRAVRPVPETPENVDWKRHERDYGQYVRTLRLPRSVDVNNISAQVEHGVLRITAPKTQTAQRMLGDQGQQQKLLQSPQQQQQQVQGQSQSQFGQQGQQQFGGGQQFAGQQGQQQGSLLGSQTQKPGQFTSQQQPLQGQHEQGVPIQLESQQQRGGLQQDKSDTLGQQGQFVQQQRGFGDQGGQSTQGNLGIQGQGREIPVDFGGQQQKSGLSGTQGQMRTGGQEDVQMQQAQ